MLNKVKTQEKVTRKDVKVSEKNEKRAKLRKLRERPYAQAKFKKPSTTKIIMGVSGVLSALAIGYVATKLGGNDHK